MLSTERKNVPDSCFDKEISFLYLMSLPDLGFTSVHNLYIICIIKYRNTVCPRNYRKSVLLFCVFVLGRLRDL